MVDFPSKLIISRNLEPGNLQSLPTGLLDPCSNLTELWANDNALSQIPVDLFLPTPFLHTLLDISTYLALLMIFDRSFANNRLSRFDANQFQDLTSLSVLSLAGNQIDSLPIGLFSTNHQLTQLFVNLKFTTTLIFSQIPQ